MNLATNAIHAMPTGGILAVALEVFHSESGNLFLRDEAHWLERVAPELEWDESEAALLVEDIIGGSRMRGYT